MSLLDDLVPEPLQQWDTNVLARLRAEHVGETLFFEFKSAFDGAIVEKTVCAFANRFGGYLMLGVNADASNRISDYPGLEPADWLRRVGDWVVGHISPLPSWDTVQVGSPDNPARSIVITRIEDSARTPHLLTSNGRIYLRSPAGSDPVQDKATLDSLVARGSQGSAMATHRADELHQLSPGSDLMVGGTAGAYLVQIAVVPSPGLGGAALGAVVTEHGYRESGSIFDGSPMAGVRPKRLLRDGVTLVAGSQAASRFTDGAVFLREAMEGSYIGTRPLSARVAGILSASAEQRPAVHQAFLDFRLISANARPMDPDGLGREPSARPLTSLLWESKEEVGTSVSAAQEAGARIERRLWRTVGDTRGFEP